MNELFKFGILFGEVQRNLSAGFEHKYFMEFKIRTAAWFALLVSIWKNKGFRREHVRDVSNEIVSKNTL